MDRGRVAIGSRQPTPAALSPYEGYRFPLLLTSFVAAYAVLQGVLALSAGAASEAYAVSVILLALLAAAMFLPSLADPRAAAARGYVVLSILPVLTVARIAFGGASTPLVGPLLVYLLLAVTVLALRPSPGVPSELPVLGRRQLARALALGGALAAGITILAFFLPFPVGTVDGPPWLPALLFAPVALLDELWFRGILQGSIARLTSAPSGWIATAVLFAAYGEPFGTPSTLLFRIALGLAFGALAMRRENLPVTLVARTAITAALLALSPGLAATSLLV